MAHILAEVVMKNRKGSILQDRGKITSSNIDKYRPTEEYFEKAGKLLEEYGFKVLSMSRFMITISGDKKLFEEVFNTNIEKYEKQVTENDSQEYYRNKEPFKIPEHLKQYIEDIILPVPPTYFI
jgi:subtilase family serine protease